MENLLKQIEELRERVIKVAGFLDIEGRKSKIRDWKREVSKPDFWDDRERAIEISKKLEDTEKEVNTWEDLRKDIRDLEEFAAIADKEGDESIYDEAYKQYQELSKKFEKLEFLLLFSARYDENNAIITIHAGSGGVDAQDWARILERMYLRFCEQKGFKTQIIDRNIASEAGIKNVTIKASGRFAYGYLKSENGVHRLVRISPFDADKARHTSFALVEIIPEFREAEGIEIKDDEIRIDVYRSSGPGGQSVNTTDSAVRIVHIPTNTTVSCQSERSQHQNKENALKLLKSKLKKLEIEQKSKLESDLKGKVEAAEWGKQIRSYVMQPYKMVKDHRNNHETSDVDKVLDGGLEEFMEAYLRGLLNRL